MKQKPATSLLETAIHEIILNSKKGKYGSGHAVALIVRMMESEESDKSPYQSPVPNYIMTPDEIEQWLRNCNR